MAADTEIANLALSYVGVGKQIAELSTEQSEEARACRQFYDTVLRTMFEEFRWGFATRTVSLAVVQVDPTPEWMRSFRYPSDAAFIRRILGGVLRDVPYAIAGDNAGRLIYANLEEATVEYTKYVTDGTHYPAQFKMAVAQRLAFHIMSRLSKGDPKKLGARSNELYTLSIATARAAQANESHPDTSGKSDMIRSRG